MGEHAESAAIVYLSAWPPDEDNAHCTLIYFGQIPDLSFGLEDLEAALAAAGIRAPGRVFTTGAEWFGEEKDTPVVTLGSARLQANYQKLKAALSDAGIEWDEKWPEYKPHVTVENVGIGFPQSVELSGPVIWWGEDN